MLQRSNFTTIPGKLILVLGLLTLVLPARSQVNKGQWITGGNADFLYSNARGNTNAVINSNKTRSLQFSADGGYFFMKQLCAGISVGMSASNNKQVLDGQQTTPFQSYYSSESKITTLAFSPFLRYYFLPAAKKINIIGDISYSYSHNNESTSTFQHMINQNNGQPYSSYTSTKTSYHSNSFSIAGGPVFFLNPKVSMELLLGYHFTKYAGSGLSSNNISIGAGFHIHLDRIK